MLYMCILLRLYKRWMHREAVHPAGETGWCLTKGVRFPLASTLLRETGEAYSETELVSMLESYRQANVI